ncbi:MAG: YdcF family protein [Planctomycetota bacterium]
MAPFRISNLARRALDAWVLAVALFALVGVVRQLADGHDRMALWIQGGGLPRIVLTVVTAAFGLAVVTRWRHRRGLAAGLACLALADAVRLFGITAGGAGVVAGSPVPESLVLAILLGAWAALPPLPRSRGLAANAVLGVAVVGMGLVSVLAHLLWIGGTRFDPTRGDAIVVLGARVTHDGRASTALRDRTVEACRAYAAGDPGRPLVLSGGLGEGAPRSEPSVMARLCRERGVPAERLVLDESGVDTHATARAVAELARERGWRSVLVVSHDYHVARVRWALEREGVVSYTLPCRETQRWPTKPFAVMREVAAYLAYVLF